MGDTDSPNIGSQNCTLSYSNEWSSNGDYSLKVFSNTNKTFYFGPNTVNLGIHDVCVGKTVQFKVDVNTSMPLYVRIFYNINGNWSVQQVSVDSTSNGVSVTLNVPSNCVNLWLRVDSTMGYENVTCYTDNWSLKIIE